MTEFYEYGMDGDCRNFVIARVSELFMSMEWMETVETLSLLVYPSYSMSMEGMEAMIYITDCTLLTWQSKGKG